MFKGMIRIRNRTPFLRRETTLLLLAALLACLLPAMAEQPPHAPPQEGPGAKPGAPRAPGEKHTDKAGKKSAEEKTPSSPNERTELLNALYDRLAKAANPQDAAPVAEAIERLWLYSGSDTVNLLMERAAKAANEKNNGLALSLLDAVVELAPDFAEGWNRRAYVYFLQNDTQRALGDLRRVLALDPHHYKALEGLGQILREIGEKKAALKVFQELQRVNPQWPNIRQTIEELTREVEGQGI